VSAQLRWEAVPYSFRNRIKLTYNKRFIADTDEAEVRLSADGAQETVVLHTPNREGTIDDATELMLSGGGYASFDEARQAGQRWRQHLMIAMAHFGTGADFGETPEDVSATKGHGLIGSQFYKDRPGLIVLEYEEGAGFLQLTADAYGKQYLTDFLTGPLQAELNKEYTPQPDSHELAYSLIHAAHFESNLEGAHVLLVTAVEAIIDPKRQNRGKPIRSTVDDFKRQVKQQFSKGDPHRDTLLNGLGRMKTEGISECGQRIANELLIGKTYLDESPGEYFANAYTQRNSIVHGRTPQEGRPTRDELQARLPTLFRFVLDLLAADSSQTTPTE
jgi:hypothetical protein